MKNVKNKIENEKKKKKKKKILHENRTWVASVED